MQHENSASFNLNSVETASKRCFNWQNAPLIANQVLILTHSISGYREKWRG